MTTKEQEADVERSRSVLGILLVLAIVAATAVALYAMAQVRRTNHEAGRELPHGTIQIEVEAFDQATRSKIVALENALAATGHFDVQGPGAFRYLLPGAAPMAEPTAKKFDELTDEEWQVASRWLTMGEWFVPRVFRLDLKACVIRLGAKGGTRAFAADAGPALQRTLEGFRPSFKSARAYSRLAGVGDAGDRAAINVTFGVQSAHTIVKLPNKVPWTTAAAMKTLEKVKGAVTLNKAVRSVMTQHNWLRYYWAVTAQAEKETEFAGQDADVARALAAGRSSGAPSFLSPDGLRAVVEVTTDAEGPENAELYVYVIAQMKGALKLETEGRVPFINTPLGEK